MADLNIIEQKIRDKAAKELEEVVLKFEEDLIKLRDKYNCKTYLKFNPEASTTCMKQSQFRSQLIFALKDRYLEYMVKHKSTELLNKLEIL